MLVKRDFSCQIYILSSIFFAQGAYVFQQVTQFAIIYLRAISSSLTEDIDMAKIAANPEKHIFNGALKVKRVSSV